MNSSLLEIGCDMEALRLQSDDIFTTLASITDPRTKDWQFTKNPSIILAILGSYLYLVKVWGPAWMKNRQPYDLKYIIMAYNLAQVFLNVYFVITIFAYSFGTGGYNLVCQGIKYGTDPNSLMLLDLMFYYLMVRVADFLDTIFFLMKKKFAHISVLHVLHHTMVVFNGWLWMKFGAEGQVVLGVCLNASIHVIMYSYYFLSALGPNVQKYLWWKRYLTKMQIIQFFIMIGHASIPLFMECGYPRALIALGVPQVALILALFVNFYIQAYLKRNPINTKKYFGQFCFMQNNLKQSFESDSNANIIKKVQ